MAEDDNSRELEANLARYMRLLDSALDQMTLENIREPVAEIEAELIKINSRR